jgi:hypothetical protein
MFEMMKEHLGLQYVYEEATPIATELVSQDKKNARIFETIKELPSEWKIDMKQAIEHVNLDQIHVLINQILEGDETLASAIQQKIDQFEYDKVLQWL